jgi:hypothetical protein
VALLDQDTGVVDRLGKAKLVDAGLETALKEILDTEGQDVIELHAGLIEHTNADQTANQSVTFEQTLGVLLVEGEQLTNSRVGLVHVPALSLEINFNGRIPSSTTDLGQSKLDTPHLTLVTQAVLADNLQFRVTRKTALGTRTHDINRSTLLISGRRVLTDEPTRKLRKC